MYRYCIDDSKGMAKQGDGMTLLAQMAARRGTTPEALIERANSWRPTPRKPTVDEQLAHLKWL